MRKAVPRNLLHDAASKGDLNAVKVQLENGALIDEKDKYGYSALSLTVHEKHLTCARLLLERKADPNTRDEMHHTPLMVAAGDGNKSLMELLITNGANVNAVAKTGCTALHIAADHFAYEQGPYENILFLLMHGAESYPDNLGHTPRIIVASGTDQSLATIFDEANVAKLRESVKRLPGSTLGEDSLISDSTFQPRTGIDDVQTRQGCKNK
jgi:ankyrin repeat protein